MSADDLGTEGRSGLVARARRALDAAFPVAVTRDAGRREVGVALLVGVGVGLLTVARASFKFDNLWAEDGTVFLGGAVNEGRLASLDSWYSGYLHTIPRFFADVAASLPLSLAPTVFFLGVLVAVVAGSALVMYQSAAYIRRWPLRVLLACVPAVLPSLGYEVIGNAANLQFLLVYFVFWLLLWVPRTWVTSVLAAVAVALVALSTLLVVFLVPLAVARLIVRRGRRAVVAPLALIATTAVQVVGRTVVGAERSDLGMLPVGVVGGFRTFYDMVAPNLRPAASQLAVDVVGAVAIALCASIVLVAAFRPGSAHRGSLTPAVPRTFVVISLATGTGIWFTLAVTIGVATRYGVLMSLFLAAGLVVAVDAALDAHPAVVVRIPACVLLAAFLLAVGRGWQPDDWHHEAGKSWSSAMAEAEASCRSTDADWAELPLSPDTWAIFLPCDRVLDG